MSIRQRVEHIVSEVGLVATSAAKLSGGYSHDSWLVDCSDGRRVVVRFGESSSQVEAAVISLARSAVPAPKVLLADEQVAVLEFVEGRPLDEVLRTDANDETLIDLARELGQLTAKIGSVKFDKAGFFESDKLAISSFRRGPKQLVEFCQNQISASKRFSQSERESWISLCHDSASLLSSVDQMSRLVHSDMNPKNIIVEQRGDQWRVAAFIDWEFAYAGCPFADVGNFCRFPDEYPQHFLEAFVDGFSDACLHLTANWKLQARVLDMFAISALAVKSVGHPIGDKAAELVREWGRSGIPPLAG